VALGSPPVRTVLEFSARTWTFFASGVATGLSWILLLSGAATRDASKVAPIDKLSVVFVLVFAALFSAKR